MKSRNKLNITDRTDEAIHFTITDLNSGKVHQCQVSPESEWILSEHRWYVTKTSPKSRTHYIKSYGGGNNLYMHRVLMKADSGVRIAHRNGEGLDNRMSNLAIRDMI